MTQTRDTYASITALVRQTIDDRDQSGGIVWSDTDLLPFANAALLDLNLMLVDAGSMLVKRYFTSTFAATTDTSIDFVSLPSVGNTLPADFLTPLFLWEKLTTDTDSQYTEMDETEERLPDIQQSDKIRYWMYTSTATAGPTIQTLGSTAGRIVRILYTSQIPSFAQSTDYIPFPGARTVLAYDTLKRAALARGETELAQYADELFKDAYERYKRLHVKASQRRGRRRVPYGMKRPYRF